MAAEEDHPAVDGRAETQPPPKSGASQRGSSAGCLGTGPCSDPSDRPRVPGKPEIQGAATELHLAQARLVGANPLPDQARRTTFLRANPYSEVTDRFCRLPLPTLVYTTRGSSPRRPDADMSTTWRETSRGPLPDFHGPRGRLRTPQQLRCSPRSAPYLPARGFQAATTLIQKR